MQARRVGRWIAGIVAALLIATYFALPPVTWLLSADQLAALQTAGWVRTGGGKKADGKGRVPPAPVRAAVVTSGDMPVIISAPGTVEPLANVAVKTRVDGQITQVLFAEGDAVKTGDVLFRLDDRLVVAQIAQAEAAIAKDEASLRDAEATLARRESLIANRVVTEAALDQARYAVEGLKASIKAGKALLDSQRTQLDYLTLRAPISGRTGSLNAKVGATVRGIDSLPLVTINQTKPILVTFSVPQGELPALKRALAAQARAEIKLSGAGGLEPVLGKIAFIDNQVDKTTGAIVVKVIAENADEVLWPGLAVEVALTVEVRPNILAVPASAVLPAQQGMMTWVIDAQNKVAPRVVTILGIVGQTAYLGDGLKAGERVVTDGQIRLAPGATVSINEPGKPPARPSAVDVKDGSKKG